MTFVKTGLAIMALSLSSFLAQAQTLTGQTFQDQFEQPLAYSSETKWVLLSSEKAAGKLVKESLDALNLTDLAAKNGLYIADVSAMPGLITKLFAVPKMRDYAFKMAVVNDEQGLVGWPKQADKVSAIQVNNLDVIAVEYFDSADMLQAWIKAQIGE
ncbi:hypothetical protein THMIRHAS_23090 [Thiosulfatimonas sediminis]|uniref:FAD/FMN-containing dehydrogenase n=1 Tax=Thiosulfatimonas sediminis TaxID=2675054 RepID=A0A6F8PXV8_9GAMM|nr:hypothetical protein [Thiosulfatimonas sediminis]BBP46936.1 hypothetical protein THMIRHAS_23090 [Thiosulfatimonas sediminis]